MKRTKKPSTTQNFLDAIADVIADRVATRLAEAIKPAPPQMVPKWLPGSGKPARGRRGAAPKDEDVHLGAQRALRDSGFVTHGDPGYDEALQRYVDHRREHDADVKRRTQMSMTASLVERFFGLSGARHGEDQLQRRPKPTRSLPAGMTAWVSAGDVAGAVGCSKSKAHGYLRAAAGRSVGTGRLLRVPVDAWEAWARENLTDGARTRASRDRSDLPRRECFDERYCGGADHSVSASSPKSRTLGSGDEQA